MKRKTIILIFGFLSIVAVIIMVICVDKYLKPHQQINEVELKQPSYTQGYYDGMNDAFSYVLESEQADSLSVDIEIFFDAEVESRRKRIKELNEK